MELGQLLLIRGNLKLLRLGFESRRCRLVFALKLLKLSKVELSPCLPYSNMKFCPAIRFQGIGCLFELCHVAFNLLLVCTHRQWAEGFQLSMIS